MRSMARLAIIGWFRSIEASGIERMPADGPALVVANHDGGFLDPVLLPAALPRFPRSLAIGDPVADAACPFVWARSRASRLPRHHWRERGAFEACHAELADDGVVAISPGAARATTCVLTGRSRGPP